MDIINTPYWVSEYIRVLFGYLFLMFLWPMVVFAGHLRGKSKIYRFSFCAVAQPVLVNTVVLGFGLIHILNRWTVCAFFYGILAAVLYRRSKLSGRKVLSFHDWMVAGGIRPLVVRVGRWARNGLKRLWTEARPHLLEYLALGALLLYAMLYFSWGAFHSPGYGTSDMYVHHSWVNGLIEGKPFVDGIYPEAMHCFIYCQNMLFGTPIHSIMLFFGSIHTGAILLAAYALFRELFRWKYSPIFALLLFLIIKTPVGDAMAGVSRLQWTLPQEFGMTGLFLCPLFVMKYVKCSYDPREEGTIPRRFVNPELFLFIMALAQTITAHFYATIMAFYLCLGIGIFYLKKIFSREKFFPLAGAVLCGLFLATAPMLGALASGVPFQGSIGWALNVMKGEEAETPPQEGEIEEQPGILETAKDVLQKCWAKMQNVYFRYTGLYGAKVGEVFFKTCAAVLAFCLLTWLILPRLPAWCRGRIEETRIGTVSIQGYLPMLSAAMLCLLAQAAKSIGLMELVDSVRLCVTEEMLSAAVIVIPLDIMLTLASTFCEDEIQQAVSYLCMGAIMAIVVGTGNYHFFLYYFPSRYPTEVETLTSIINQYERKAYTIVAPTDDIWQVSGYGWHEELQKFVEGVREERYTLPSEHIFIFVEKKPLRYSNWHTFQGPAWLAQESEGDVTIWKEGGLAVISQEAAQKAIPKRANLFSLYKDLDTRTIIESKAYYWCQRFSELYPSEMKIYYEDEVFVCYYFQQEPHSPYNLAIDYE